MAGRDCVLLSSPCQEQPITWKAACHVHASQSCLTSSDASGKLACRAATHQRPSQPPCAAQGDNVLAACRHIVQNEMLHWAALTDVSYETCQEQHAVLSSFDRCYGFKHQISLHVGVSRESRIHPGYVTRTDHFNMLLDLNILPLAVQTDSC